MVQFVARVESTPVNTPFAFHVAPVRGLEGVPGLPGASQDETGLTRKFETSHVGGATLYICKGAQDTFS